MLRCDSRPSWLIGFAGFLMAILWASTAIHPADGEHAGEPESSIAIGGLTNPPPPPPWPGG